MSLEIERYSVVIECVLKNYNFIVWVYQDIFIQIMTLNLLQKQHVVAASFSSAPAVRTGSNNDNSLITVI